MEIAKKHFGSTADGQSVDLYTLVNKNGLQAKIINYGGILTELRVPDRKGDPADIVLGYDRLGDYENDPCYFGATVGRYGNRIAEGKFSLGGITYTLATNDGENHLHGGVRGFNKVLWGAEQLQDEDGVSVKLTYLSKDGEEGYPGNLDCTVIYTLTNDDELRISYEAKTDKPTIVNLTHHSYFNLAGCGSGDILGHQLMLKAECFTPVDETIVPTGEIKSVKNTPLDFVSPKLMGEQIANVAGGYDHNFVLNNSDGSLALAARVYEPGSGRVMEILTTEPGIQFYSGNFLDGSNKGKGATYCKHSGFCLETQHFPDSPNQPKFPSTVLNPGKKYTQLTVHRFSVE